ncbi:MAG: hypothetical protein ACREPV_02715 [Lysobacter sp.]
MQANSGFNSPNIVFGAVALGLLGLTLSWHIPMMLWDHLDLVQMYRASQDGGSLWSSIFWDTHGGHMHAAAYAVLLVTTELSGGQPWLDCVVSWGLLIGYAIVVVRLARSSFVAGRMSGRWVSCIAFLALYPGHLANLQWGWQVAVFLCLLGMVIAVACLAAEELRWWHNVVALAAAVLSYLSFATGIAVIPVAVAMLLLRRDRSPLQLAGFAAPWLLFGLLVLWWYLESSLVGTTASRSLLLLLHYVLNYLGSGISRFAADLAPWLALIAMATGIQAFLVVRRERASLPWLGFFLFGIFSALLTALGRAEAFGPDHAFVTRYVSFSSVFWLGWAGLVVIASRIEAGAWGKWRMRLAVTVMVLGAANALHMIKQAAEVGAETRDVANQVRDSYPNVDEALLRSIYFEQPEVARERLRELNVWSFAPFEQSAGAAQAGSK